MRARELEHEALQLSLGLEIDARRGPAQAARLRWPVLAATQAAAGRPRRASAEQQDDVAFAPEPLREDVLLVLDEADRGDAGVGRIGAFRRRPSSRCRG